MLNVDTLPCSPEWLWNHWNSREPIFMLLHYLQVRGSSFRGFVDWLVKAGGGGGWRNCFKGRITPGKQILNETSYLFYNCYCKRIATKVDSKTSIIIPLHAYWVIDSYNFMSQRPELIMNGFRKEGLSSDYRQRLSSDYRTRKRV